MTPSAHLYLGDHGVSKEGRHYLTPELKSENELDWWIDTLIDELEKARKQGKKKFGEAKRK